MNRDMRATSNDRILRWPIVLAASGPVIFFPLAVLLGIPVLLFILAPIWVLPVMAWAGAGVFALMVCIVTAFERAWRQCLSALILPLTVLVFGLNIEAVWRASQSVGDYLHLFLIYPSLVADIAKLPADRPKLKAWGWEPTMTHELGIAYDESDEIASEHPSEEWLKRAEQAGVSGYGYRPLYGHFYLVELR